MTGVGAESRRPVTEIPLRHGPLPRATGRYLVRFGYDGGRYAGWARQPGLRTVEGVIRAALVERGVSSSDDAAELAVASRTDRGVHARANALVLSSGLPPTALLRTLNGIAPDIFFTASTEIDAGFRVRRAAARTYRYFESPVPKGIERWTAAAELFRGEVDVRSFGRGIRPGDASRRHVTLVRFARIPGGLYVEVIAPSFVWGMVRKIVSALREVGEGRLTIPRLRAAIEGSVHLTLPLAEPDRLVLWEVDYGRAWEHVWRGPNRHQERWIGELRAGWVSRGAMLDALDSGARPTAT